MSVPAFLQWASSFAGTAIVAAFMLLRYRSWPRIAGGTTCDLLASLVARELGEAAVVRKVERQDGDVVRTVTYYAFPQHRHALVESNGTLRMHAPARRFVAKALAAIACRNGSMLASARFEEHIFRMKLGARKVALVAVSAALGACSVETGTVLVGVTCEGEGCNHSGDLLTRIEDCDEDTGRYGAKAVSAELGTASTFAFTFENVLAGTRCVQAFLDVDTSGSLSAGDVVSSEAVQQGVGEESDNEDDFTDDDPELDVDVPDDDTVEVDVVLDAIVPNEL